MAVTVIDVARAAGVSKSTAARALAGDPGVSGPTKAKVLAAAAKLNYRVNRLARGLRGGNSRLIGLLVTNMVNASVQVITEVLQTRASQEGYQILLGITGGDPVREAGIVEALIDNRVDGLITMSTAENVDLFNRHHANGLPVVNLIRRPRGTDAPSVVPDNFHGAYEATRYLLDLGHTSIAYVGGPSAVASGRERLNGYKSAMDERGLEIAPELIIKGAFEPAFGAQAATELFAAQDHFTGLVVANHEALFGLLPALAERGMSIPGQLSVVGFEDTLWFPHWHPPITVVDVDPVGLGNSAMDALLEQIHGGCRADPVAIRSSTRLIVRSSAARPTPHGR